MHPALLLGLGLAIIPVVLHLLLKAKPKRLIFPALRLIQQNRKLNVQRMQLRHLWLLLLRIMLIVLLVFALTRPSLPAANYSFTSADWIRLLIVVTLCAGGYWGLSHWLNSKRSPRHEYLTRRTLLRGGIGVMTFLLLLLIVGWPYGRRVAAEIKSPAPKLADNIPVAAIFLFDNSPSMGYRKDNQTRLQSAQQIARDHLSRFPSGSKLAVTALQDDPSPVFSLDLQAAKGRVDATEVKSGSLPLNDRLRSMLLAQEDDLRRETAEQSGPDDQKQDRFLREIYLFTDLARSAWREDTSTLLRDELERLKTVAIYLIDVGETAPTNVGIREIRLARDTIPDGGTLKLDAVMTASGNIKSDQTIELYLGDPSGKQSKVGQKNVTLEQGVERNLTFEVPNITGTYQQGEVRIVGNDQLAFDDVNYFTVQTLPPLKVLIVAETPTIAKYWQAVLGYLSSEKITSFSTEFVTTTNFRSKEVNQFDIVFLINVPALDSATWKKLHEFVSGGGGLGIVLGASSAVQSGTKRGDVIDPVSYGTEAAQSVLPGSLRAALPFSSPQTMDLRNTQHPLLKRLEDLNALTELGALEIQRYWKVEPVETGIVIAKYTDKSATPAIVERRLGEGRVVMLTTSVNNTEWNDFQNNPWFFVFVDQLSQYLSQLASQRCNYVIGSEAAIPLSRVQKPKKVVVRMPDFKQKSQEIKDEATMLLLRDLTSVGSYQIDSSESNAPFHAGFSMNNPPNEDDLKRLEKTDLDVWLGEGRYSVNRDPAGLERTVQTGRLGQEVYSVVVALLVAVFVMEQLTSTWFYRTDEV